MTSDGDLILVTNGIYSTGGRSMDGILTNRVSLDKAVTVQSVNGPSVTTIQGTGATNGPNAVRCAWLTNNASLIGFKLRWGATRSPAIGTGGGVYGTSSNLSVVANCVVISNTAYDGGGAFRVSLNNCLIATNSGTGGAFACILRNCTVVSNSSPGVYDCTATNCIIYYNPQNNSGSSLSYCCITPLASGPGNFTAAPQLFTDGIHLAAGSPCIGAGTNIATGTDIFGNPWANPPSVGCAEFQQTPLVATPQLTVTNNPIGFQITAAATGVPPVNYSWLKDGVPLVDDGHFTSTQTTNLIVYGVEQTDVGNYQLVVSNASGVVTSAVVSVVAHYVDASATNATAPYATWDTAASTIQDAIDTANSSEIVFVTNGVYNTGGKLTFDGVTNRVTIDKALIVQSINGPFVTTIEGAGATNGPNAMRCAYVNYNAALNGFTIQGGATRTSGTAVAEWGGGVFGASPSGSKTVLAKVSNCILVSNSAYQYGAGAYGAILDNCLVESNFSVPAILNCGLCNCTVISNSSIAVASSFATNCIVYNNATNWSTGAFFNSSCTTPMPSSGTGNFTNSPSLFVDGLHLSAGSRCIGAGLSITSGTDIFGNTWSNPPSIGCAEWTGQPIVAPQLTVTATAPGRLQISATATGQPPLTYSWLQNGNMIQDGDSFTNTSSTNLIVSALNGAGSFQLVASNAFGVATSGVAQIVIHYVDANSTSPASPYNSWSTAAATIQDAIDAANAGEFVLVTNGVYATGGKSIDGVITNRITADKPLTILSVDGPLTAIIQGAYDPTPPIGITVGGPGPLAVRSAWLTNGATLMGFTVQGGATRSSGATSDVSGGGVYCSSSAALVSNCILTSNRASLYGGGIAYGTINNSYIANNLAHSGGGACYATLKNCTVNGNNLTTDDSRTILGAGIYDSVAYNCIITGNYDNSGWIHNWNSDPSTQLTNCCTSPLPSGSGNIDASISPPLFMDALHIAANCSCRGNGSALYTSGTDIDGETWATPPSIGCDEVIDADLVGPLTVSVSAFPTNGTVGHTTILHGIVSGRASALMWSVDGGPTITNGNYFLNYTWTNPGTYNVAFTAYNNDNLTGVSSNLTVVIAPVYPPLLPMPFVSSNGVELTIPTQSQVTYYVQVATNLTTPISWTTLRIFPGFGDDVQFTDTATNFPIRFYRVQAQ